MTYDPNKATTPEQEDAELTELVAYVNRHVDRSKAGEVQPADIDWKKVERLNELNARKIERELAAVAPASAGHWSIDETGRFRCDCGTSEGGTFADGTFTCGACGKKHVVSECVAEVNHDGDWLKGIASTLVGLAVPAPDSAPEVRESDTVSPVSASPANNLMVRRDSLSDAARSLIAKPDGVKELADKVTGLAGKATPGPWNVERGLGRGMVPEQDAIGSEALCPAPREWVSRFWITSHAGDAAEWPQNTAFIADSRTSAPLLAEVARQVIADNERLRGELKTADEKIVATHQFLRDMHRDMHTHGARLSATVADMLAAIYDPDKWSVTCGPSSIKRLAAMGVRVSAADELAGESK